MELLEEIELVKQAKESLQAFDRLYDFYLPKIMAYIVNRTGNKEIAEDVTSQTFVTAMLKLEKFQYKGVGFGPWLYKIASNTLVDYYRKHKEAYKPVEEIDITPTAGNSMSEDIDNKILIINALRKLPEESQQIISLKYFEELDNEDIAEIVGCKKATLAVKLHRSLSMLEKILTNETKLNLN